MSHASRWSEFTILDKRHELPPPNQSRERRNAGDSRSEPCPPLSRLRFDKFAAPSDPFSPSRNGYRRLPRRRCRGGGGHWMQAATRRDLTIAATVRANDLTLATVSIDRYRVLEGLVRYARQAKTWARPRHLPRG